MHLDCAAGRDGLDWREAVGPAEVFVCVVDCGDGGAGGRHCDGRKCLEVDICTLKGNRKIRFAAEKCPYSV